MRIIQKAMRIIQKAESVWKSGCERFTISRVKRGYYIVLDIRTLGTATTTNLPKAKKILKFWAEKH